MAGPPNSPTGYSVLWRECPGRPYLVSLTGGDIYRRRLCRVRLSARQRLRRASAILPEMLPGGKPLVHLVVGYGIYNWSQRDFSQKAGSPHFYMKGPFVDLHKSEALD